MATRITSCASAPSGGSGSGSAPAAVERLGSRDGSMSKNLNFRERMERVSSERTLHAFSTEQPLSCRFLHLPWGLVEYTISHWPARTLAALAATCQECRSHVSNALDLAEALAGYSHHPRSGRRISRLHELNFRQLIAGRSPTTTSAGRQSVLCIRDAGRTVYSWGGDYHERAYVAHLGHVEGLFTGRNVNVPRPVAGLPQGVRVREVAAGGIHSLLLSEAGHLYSWGNGSCGQLGHADLEVAIEKRLSHPRRVESLASTPCVQIACGGDHSLCLSADGEVFAFGRSTYGQCGHGDTQNVYTPRPVSRVHLGDRRIVSLSAGGQHSMAIDETRTLHSWGFGHSGRCGHGMDDHGRCENVLAPMPILALAVSRVLTCACGDMHSAAISEAGEVYTWGCADNGRLGHPAGEVEFQSGIAPQQTIPMRIGVLTGLAPAVAAAACKSHTVVLLADGSVYHFGERACLGVAQTSAAERQAAQGHHHHLKARELLLARADALGSAEDDGVPPTRVLCAERISEVSVGTHHTVLRACSGTVYTYGRGAEGQLGHGAWEARRTPTAIPTCAFH